MKVPRYDRMVRARSAFLGRPWTPTITWASPGDLTRWQQGTLGRRGRYEIIGGTVIVTTGPISIAGPPAR